MKRLIAAVCLMGLAITVAVTTNALANHHVDHVIEMVEKMNSKGIFHLSDMEKLEREWDKTHDMLSLFVNHDNIDKISECIAAIKAYVYFDNQQPDDFSKTEIGRLLFMLHHMKDSENLSIYNLL